MKKRAAIPALGRKLALTALASLSLAGQPSTDPAHSPRPSEAPAAAGLGQRPNPPLAKVAPSGLSLRPLDQHRKLGTVYFEIRPNSFSVAGPVSGLRTSPSPLLGYAVPRTPVEAAGNGSMGSVIAAGQFQIAWISLLSEEALAPWKSTNGGPLNLDTNPMIAVTVRNAVDTRQLSRGEFGSSYICTLIADFTINGISIESIMPETVISFSRQDAGAAGVKGDQMTLRTKCTIRLKDFFTTIPGTQTPPSIDISADLILSTVPPEAQSPAPAQPSEPAPGEPPPSTPK